MWKYGRETQAYTTRLFLFLNGMEKRGLGDTISRLVYLIRCVKGSSVWEVFWPTCPARRRGGKKFVRKGIVHHCLGSCVCWRTRSFSLSFLFDIWISSWKRYNKEKSEKDLVREFSQREWTTPVSTTYRTWWMVWPKRRRNWIYMSNASLSLFDFKFPCQ